MEYRRLPRGGEMISILGLGTSSIPVSYTHLFLINVKTAMTC